MLHTLLRGTALFLGVIAIVALIGACDSGPGAKPPAIEPAAPQTCPSGATIETPTVTTPASSLPGTPSYSVLFGPAPIDSGATVTLHLWNMSIPRATGADFRWRRTTGTGWSEWQPFTGSIADFRCSTEVSALTLPDRHVGGRNYEVAVRGTNSVGGSQWLIVRQTQASSGAYSFTVRTAPNLAG